MDFSTTPRPTFGGNAPAFGRHAQHREEAPTAFKGKAAIRRAAMFKEAAELLTALPGPGESTHLIQAGSLDLCVLLMAILDAHPAPCRVMRIATLCYAKRNCVELLGALESKKIGTLTLLASNFFKSHYKELDQWFSEELKAFPGSRTASARNHAKIVCIDFSDENALVLSGSSNLRGNHNTEALAITRDRDLHDWYAAWIDAQMGVNDGDA